MQVKQQPNLSAEVNYFEKSMEANTYLSKLPFSLGISLISFSGEFSICVLKVYCCENLAVNFYLHKHDKDKRNSVFTWSF